MATVRKLFLKLLESYDRFRVVGLDPDWHPQALHCRGHEAIFYF